jgi:hypothetical protein
LQHFGIDSEPTEEQLVAFDELRDKLIATKGGLEPFAKVAVAYAIETDKPQLEELFRGQLDYFASMQAFKEEKDAFEEEERTFKEEKQAFDAEMEEKAKQRAAQAKANDCLPAADGASSSQPAPTLVNTVVDTEDSIIDNPSE